MKIFQNRVISNWFIRIEEWGIKDDIVKEFL